MLIQHLLTARLFGTSSPTRIHRRNVVAVEIEKVIDALASPLRPCWFLGKLDRFYLAIESPPHIDDFSEKQSSLNTVNRNSPGLP